MSVNARGSARSYHHGDLRSATLRAVASAIKDVGLGQLSLREVARRVGVSNRAPAHHFRDKAGLLTEFASEGYELMARSVTQSVASVGAATGPDILAAMGQGYVHFAVTHPEHFEVMFRMDLLRPSDPRFIAATNRAFGLLAASVAQCEREGQLRGRDPEAVAVAAWSLVHGLSALWLSGRLAARILESDPDQLAKRVTRLFVDSVLA